MCHYLAAYNEICMKDYINLQLNHDCNFIDPVPESHIRSIENMWG